MSSLNSMNKVSLIGRLGQDPKLTYLPSGRPVAEMSVATSETYKNQAGEKVEQTEWHRVKVFGESAKFYAQHLTKGRLVYVEGTLKTRSWEKDGQKHYTTEIVLANGSHCIKFLEKKKPGQEEDGEPGPEESGYEDVPF
ncbi:MAG: single-stranded DNA-binding protein [Acidobacteriota bacterium]